MRLRRRDFLRLTAAVPALPAASRLGWAESYPSRPVRLIVGFPAGGSVDIQARLIGQWLSERLSRPFIVENRPGAAGTLGTEVVVRAPPDGYTLLLVNTTNAINATLYDNLKFDFIRDIVPIGTISREPNVMQVHPSFPASTVPEFIAHARRNPGKVNFGSGGHGSIAHLSTELFKMMTAVNITHVPYRGGAPALTDLVGGQLQVMIPTMSASIEYARAGKLRALAVTTTTRSPVLANVPVMADFVPGYEASFWGGIGAPRGTPGEIVDRLNSEINAALASSRIGAQLAEQGNEVLGGSPADFGQLMAEEIEKWRKVIRTANIKPE